MIPSWLEHAAAFIVLWFALAIILGVLLAAFIRSRHANRTGHPNGNPTTSREDDPFAELFFEAAREQDEWEAPMPTPSLNKALAAFQAELPKIPKDATGEIRGNEGRQAATTTTTPPSKASPTRRCPPSAVTASR